MTCVDMEHFLRRSYNYLLWMTNCLQLVNHLFDCRSFSREGCFLFAYRLLVFLIHDILFDKLGENSDESCQSRSKMVL